MKSGRLGWALLLSASAFIALSVTMMTAASAGPLNRSSSGWWAYTRDAYECEQTQSMIDNFQGQNWWVAAGSRHQATRYVGGNCPDPIPLAISKPAGTLGVNFDAYKYNPATGNWEFCTWGGPNYLMNSYTVTEWTAWWGTGSNPSPCGAGSYHSDSLSVVYSYFGWTQGGVGSGDWWFAY